MRTRLFHAIIAASTALGGAAHGGCGGSSGRATPDVAERDTPPAGDDGAAPVDAAVHHGEMDAAPEAGARDLDASLDADARADARDEDGWHTTK